MVCLGRVVSPSMYFLFFSIFLATFGGRKSLTKYWTLPLLENFFPLVVAKKSMRNNQQTQNYQTIKPSSSTEIIPDYNRTNTQLLRPFCFAVRTWWNHLNTDNFSMSSYSPCLLLDKDKLSHSSLRQNHKTVIYNAICVVLAKVLFLQTTTGNTVTQWGFEAHPLSPKWSCLPCRDPAAHHLQQVCSPQQKTCL